MLADDEPRSRSGDERDSSAPATEAANHNGSRNNDHKSKEAKKRKNEEDAEKQAKKPKVVENRAIFVSNLPLDADETEIEDAFKKYGIIDQGTDGNPRIKMYADKEGNFIGEALVVYFKKESIKIAIDMMDDYWFRVEEPHRKIHVQEADASFKRNTDGEQIVKKMSRQDRKANERNRAELNRKLAEWSDDDEDEVKKTYAPKKNKHAKICIVKHAFTLEELKDDEDAIADIKGDMQEEAEKHGEVTKVVLYDEEEDGVLTIRFSTFEAAESFRAAVHNRSFGGRHLQVTIAEDRPRFKKSVDDHGLNQDLSDDEAD